MIDLVGLESLMNQHYSLHTSDELLEMLDNKISCILEKTRKFIKDRQRTVPFSKAKVIVRALLLY